MGEARKIEDIPADELHILICRFMMEIDGDKGGNGAYEPATRQSFQRNQKRYLNDKTSKLNREVLLHRKKQLVFEEAKGNRPHVAKELSNAEEDLLYIPT